MQSIEKQDTDIRMRDLEAERQKNGHQEVTQATRIGKRKDGVAEEKESWRGVVVLCGCMMLSRMFSRFLILLFKMLIKVPPHWQSLVWGMIISSFSFLIRHFANSFAYADSGWPRHVPMEFWFETSC